MKNPERRVSYTMEILAGNRNGAAAPLFRITPEDGPPMKGYDTRALWLDIAQQIGEVRERLGQAGGAPYFKSGPSMFGFSDVKIVPLIESLPNAREWCTNYAAWHDGHPPAHPNTPLSAKPKAPPLTAKAPSEPPPATYQPLNLTFRHDRCAVCYIEQDYDDNQLVQCDKCRVMVHMHCYGELEPPDGDLWLCQLCQEDALKEPPPCCLCPVVGGAMKPTNDGRWAHLTCAIWIPETLLKPHQIEKVDAIGKDRWKLRCSICRVKHGACIQCEDKSCKTAFHPLCARGRGLCMEVVTSKDVPATSYQRSRERGRTPLRGGKKSGETKGEEERNNEKRANKLAREGTDSERERRTERGAAQAQNHATSAGAKLRGDSEAPDVAGECSGAAEREEEEHDEEEDTLRLLAWCARHKPPEAGKAGRVLVRERRDAAGPSKVRAEDYVPPANPSGCARTEPFDPAARRGQRAPEAVATALAKRLFVRQVPYEITGRRHADRRPAPGAGSSKTLQTLDRRKAHAGPRAGLAAAGDALEAGPGLLGDGPKSATERYIMMKTTQGQRLAFGKSAIHGWGVFAKQRHAQASFVTEYAGEVVRQAVADAREKNLYNSIVGAGTYMFRIDDQRVVDATKAGSLAHLINHACEPNCFSRVVRADGDEHIVITAKRDILPGEEFTYDYRFNSKDEILTCNCGAPSCRGTVNFYDEDEGDEYGRVMAPVSEIKPWDPTKPMKGV
ncbi:histone-lysine N-methyltransferase [Klebsormidium nitens]|uniref:Histone-lysine N-methyltransferase n=1 Tax=Klebsormidium nitens TaxID=105231 RepID=A0A1Y1IR83_KLENI|nr:histone-lysine N-methyltransferase [Klebsormidium nitens]|eukprot:GAQ91137.1 histone-lysine N-methyltransferase [Klebsormidium nitens]